MSTSPLFPPTPFDIHEFAALWTSIYHHHEAIGTTPPSWIAYPPHTSPPLNTALCHELGLDSKLIDLLALLPYPVDDDASSAFAFLPRTQAQPFLDDITMRSARDPWMDYLGEVGRGERLEKWEVALTGAQRYGWLLILDVRAGTIREWNTMEGPPEGSDLVDPNNERSYVNYPTKPAIDVVKGYLSKFQSLEWISVQPDRESGICEGSEGAKHTMLERELRENYGWPNAFRKDEWINDRDRIMNRIVRELYM